VRLIFSPLVQLNGCFLGGHENFAGREGGFFVAINRSFDLAKEVSGCHRCIFVNSLNGELGNLR